LFGAVAFFPSSPDFDTSLPEGNGLIFILLLDRERRQLPFSIFLVT